MKPRTRILIICTGNAARSQISEGLFRHHGGEHLEVLSAGTHPAGFVHPMAIETMKERGIDISGHTSKPLDQFTGQTFDYVITVCDDAQRECPAFPGGKHHLHWSTPDPSFVGANDEARRNAFRKTILSLESRIRLFLAELRQKKKTTSQ